MRVTCILAAVLALAAVLGIGMTTGWRPAAGCGLIAVGMALVVYWAALWEEEKEWSDWADQALSDAELDAVLSDWSAA